MDKQVDNPRAAVGYPADAMTPAGNAILLLRLVMAFLVIFAHSWWAVAGNDLTEPLMRLTRGEMNSGALAVDAFFVLSGMLITASWCRSRQFTGYLMKRILRIFPAFMVLCLVQAFVLVPRVAKGTQGITLQGVGDVLLFAVTLGGQGRESLPGYAAFADHPSPDLNASLWTIRPEFFCYLFLGALGIVRALYLGPVRWALFLVFLALFVLQPDWEWHELLKGALGTFHYWPRFMVFFLAGVCLHFSGHRLPGTARVSWCLAAALLASTLHPVLLRIALPTVGAWLLHNLCSSAALTRVSDRLPGDVSYGVYLYGFPCQQLLVSAIGTHWSPYWFSLASLAVALVPASLSWWLIEKPCLNLGRSLAAGNTRESLP